MPEISLTDFVDFVIKSGGPKQTQVKTVKERDEYAPAFDYWKQVRDGIREFHKNGASSKCDLDQIVNHLADKRKRANYQNAINGYKKFLGRKSFGWWIPPWDVWNHAGLDVRINPELGLVIDDERYLVKLYFKSENPSKARLGSILDLMDLALAPKVKKPTTMAVLDITKAKLHTADPKASSLVPLLLGEAESFIRIWNML